MLPWVWSSRPGGPERRARLLKLEHYAESREFFRITRLVREALDKKPEATASQKR